METSHSPSSTNNPEEGFSPGKDDQNIISFDFMGYLIYVGRNAASNDTLVLEHKNHPKCIWFHVVGGKGAHVVLCTKEKEEPDMTVIRRAADLAYRFAKTDRKLVRYAHLEDVYKPENMRVGSWRTWRTTIIELNA